MSRKTIPEKVIINCDFCCGEFSKTDYLMEQKVTLDGSSLDRDIPVGPAYKSGTYDCCYGCFSEIRDKLNKGKGKDHE